MATQKRPKIKQIPTFVVGDQAHPWGGLNTIVKDIRDLDRGESYDQLNWITGRDKDHIELRRGSVILGKTKRNIAGAQVKGIGIGIKNDGTQVPFYKVNRSIYYYDESINDTVEIGTNILPAAAIDDNFSFMPYQNLAGSYIYGTSKHSSIYKFSVANLGSFIDFRETTLGNPTISIATPAVITLASHGLIAGNTVVFTTTGALPTGITQNVRYFVLAAGLSANTFEISLTDGGAAINTTGSQSGTHTLLKVTDALDYHFNFAKINRGYMFGMNRGGASVNSNDSTGEYLSVPDSISNNSTVLTFSVGTGDGTTKTFSGTISLPFPNTAYFVSITDTVEQFIDDKNGHLVGSLGGVGTIDYISGLYSVTFHTAPANSQAITGSYQQEDSTVGGVADFTGMGSDIFRQDDGGGIAEATWPYQGVEYCFHQLRSWLLTIDTTQTPTAFDNQPYYEQIGVPSPLAVFPTGDGIVFLNNAIPTNPKVAILKIPPGSTNLTVVPTSLSDALDLSQYGIDECVAFRWSDWDFISLKGVTNGQTNEYNSKTFIRNTTSGLWSLLGNYFINCMADYKGTLLGGSSIGSNVMQLLFGFSDNNTKIPNYNNQAFTNLQLEGLKQSGYLNLSGLIQSGQNLDVFISIDLGEYVKVGTIMGNGNYVNSSQVIPIGTQGIGIGVVGGGFDEAPIFASPYEIDIPIYYPFFEYISWAVQATGNGYVSVDRQEWKDIRQKRLRLFPSDDSQINS